MEALKMGLEIAGKMVDKHITADSNFPSLINLMRYNAQGIILYIICIQQFLSAFQEKLYSNVVCA